MRYVPKRYYFQMIALLRSFSLCLIPAVLRDKPAPQVLVICAVLSSYVLAVDNLRPWRARVCNILDSGAGMLFIMFLVCGAIFLENASGNAGMQVGTDLKKGMDRPTKPDLCRELRSVFCKFKRLELGS